MSDYILTPARVSGATANISIAGPAGSGKTFTALTTMHYLLDLDPQEIKEMSDSEYDKLLKKPLIAVIDTERRRILKYANRKRFGFVFHACFPSNFIHSGLREAIKQFEKAGYKGVIVDSFSHYWIGHNGILNLVDKINQSEKGAGWRKVSPLEKEMWDELLGSNMHVICTMRAKMEWVYKVDAEGRMLGMEKVGLAPVQRGDVEYEFDIHIDMDMSHTARVTKATGDDPDNPTMQDQSFIKPRREIADYVKEWLALKESA